MTRGVARRYARALFGRAAETSETDAIHEDLRQVRGLLDTTPEFRRLCEHPLIPAERRRAALTAALGERVRPGTLTFLNFLAGKGRLGLLREIVTEFNRLYDQLKGVAQAHVRSAHPLTDAQCSALAGRLGEKLNAQVTLSTEINPALLAGFTVQVGDRIYDASAATMLERFKQTLIHA
jgi:F-type H+-transporting ATPase subunit delta